MKSLAGLILALIVSTAWAETPVCPAPGDWRFVPEFSDEFNGDKLDGSKWWDLNPMWVGRKPGLYVRDNVAVKDGMPTVEELPATFYVDCLRCWQLPDMKGGTK